MFASCRVSSPDSYTGNAAWNPAEPSGSLRWMRVDLSSYVSRTPAVKLQRSVAFQVACVNAATLFVPRNCETVLVPLLKNGRPVYLPASGP